MAQSKKKTAASKKTTTKKRTKTNTRAVQPPEPVVPMRREFGGVLFFFLALFTAIGYFIDEGAFVCYFSGMIKGLVGWGYWLAAAAFLLVSFILFFHRGKPVTLRSICALLIPIFFAALISQFVYNTDMLSTDARSLTNTLFEQGQRLESAGVLGGLLAIGLKSAFSIYGALPVLLILLIACCICAFNGSFRKAADKVKIQVETKYDPSMYGDVIQPVQSVKGNIPVVKEKMPVEHVSRNAYSMDIPLGEDADDDIISLLEGGKAKSGKAAPEPRTRRKGKKESGLTGTATDNVAPLSASDAAKIAGVDLDLINSVASASAEDKKQKPEKNVVVSAEISNSPKIKRINREEAEAEAQAMAAQVINASEDPADYEFPPMSLLKSSKASSADYNEEIILNKNRLDKALKSFGISANIVGVTRGPTVTRYDFELDQGVKLARVTNLAGDLALALGVVNVRIAPIPEKISTIGIEVPNKIISSVFLRDIIDTPKFASSKSKLSFALGKDISGDAIIGNIAKLPHLLIAGTTGSGKSVCMNSLILSLLYKARPDEVKLIMIDPKMVELGVYNGIPHMYVPVVTDPKKAAGALQWSVVEMLKRYRLFSEIGVRDLENYNNHCAAVGDATLPQVVIVIDELADLMMAASKEVEESICRIAQMGRAAGMHLVIATQRPSADVITGLMKANIPSRIAFAVSSSLESRIILDQVGAEKLIGMGDMLFAPVGCGKPMRIQGAFVSDEEREEVIQFIKQQSSEAAANSEIEEYMTKAAQDKPSGDKGKAEKDEDSAMAGFDDMLPQAAEVVLETKSCSVSMLQRRLKLGYSRAARIVDQMEELGIVGPYEGAKPRQVVVDREGWNDIQRKLGLLQDDDMALAAEMSEDCDDFRYDN